MTSAVRLRWDPYVDPYEGAMKFRLTYAGPLQSAGNTSHAANKHAIRMCFHRQLKRLWERHAELSELSQTPFPDYETAVFGRDGGPWPGRQTTPYRELVSSNHQAHGHRWFPTVVGKMTLTCAVDVLFLRLGRRGSVFNVGDIDGRLKTIFDALAIPRDGSQVTRPEDDPTYVLLEDDSLISHATVEADELLEPTSSEVGQNDARIIITVNIRMTRPGWMALRFAGD